VCSEKCVIIPNYTELNAGQRFHIISKRKYESKHVENTLYVFTNGDTGLNKVEHTHTVFRKLHFVGRVEG
jgi:hypothetical protein